FFPLRILFLRRANTMATLQEDAKRLGDELRAYLPHAESGGTLPEIRAGEHPLHHAAVACESHKRSARTGVGRLPPGYNTRLNTVLWLSRLDPIVLTADVRRLLINDIQQLIRWCDSGGTIECQRDDEIDSFR